LGNPLAVSLTGGQVHDINEAEPLAAQIDPGALLADKGYDADSFIDSLFSPGTSARPAALRAAIPESASAFNSSASVTPLPLGALTLPSLLASSDFSAVKPAGLTAVCASGPAFGSLYGRTMSRITAKKILRSMIGGSEQFQRNFLSLASANAAAQLIGIVSLPLLTRIFSPADFGILAIFTACQGFALAAATGRVEWLLPGARNRGQAAALIGLGLAICGASGLIVLAAAALFADKITALVGLPVEHSNVLYLVPLGIMGGGMQLILQAWHTRKGKLSAVSVSKMCQSILTMFASLAAGLAGIGAWGLISSYLLGIWTAVAMLLRRESFLLGMSSRVRLSHIRNAFRYSRGEIGSSLALGIVNALTSVSTTIMISLYYGPAIVGWYALAFRLGAAPVTLFTMALAYSFWATGAELVRTDAAQLRQFYLRSLMRLAVPGLILTLVFLAGPLYVGPLFGPEKWAGAGALLAASAPYLFGLIVLSPTTHLVIYGKQFWQLGCDLFTLIAMWTAFGIAAGRGAEAWEAVLAASLVLLFGYIIRALAYLKANSMLQAEQNARR
jgi:O-antigen/teichoic acid export membrane protein